VIVFAAIAPHGDVDSPPELLAAMEELGRRFEAAAPEAAIVVTPHNVHVEGHFAVVTAARVGEHENDRELAAAALGALRAEGLPVVGVSYGGNDPAQAEHPLDWGRRSRSASCARSASSSSARRATDRSPSTFAWARRWHGSPGASP